MIQRRTQTAEYWQRYFSLTDEDVSYLYSLVIDAGKPVSTANLAREVIERHCRQEELLIQAELSKGPVYQPKDHYEIGQKILFPLLIMLLEGGVPVDFMKVVFLPFQSETILFQLVMEEQ